MDHSCCEAPTEPCHSQEPQFAESLALPCDVGLSSNLHNVLQETIDALMQDRIQRGVVWDLLLHLGTLWGFEINAAEDIPGILEVVDCSFDDWREAEQQPTHEQFATLLLELFVEECGPPHVKVSTMLEKLL